jgi:hypothetical protein
MTLDCPSPGSCVSLGNFEQQLRVAIGEEE